MSYILMNSLVSVPSIVDAFYHLIHLLLGDRTIGMRTIGMRTIGMRTIGMRTIGMEDNWH